MFRVLRACDRLPRPLRDMKATNIVYELCYNKGIH